MFSPSQRLDPNCPCYTEWPVQVIKVLVVFCPKFPADSSHLRLDISLDTLLSTTCNLCASQRPHLVDLITQNNWQNCLTHSLTHTSGVQKRSWLRFPYFIRRIKRMVSSCQCVQPCDSLPPNNFQINWRISTKLAISMMPLEFKSPLYISYFLTITADM
jgi:hypothetical protein